MNGWQLQISVWFQHMNQHTGTECYQRARALVGRPSASGMLDRSAHQRDLMYEKWRWPDPQEKKSSFTSKSSRIKDFPGKDPNSNVHVFTDASDALEKRYERLLPLLLLLSEPFRKFCGLNRNMNFS